MENHLIENSACDEQNAPDFGASRRRTIEVYASSSSVQPLEYYLGLVEDYWHLDSRTPGKIRQAMEIYGFRNDFDPYGHLPIG